MMETKTSPAHTVSVAMATYNGERYLREQIDSIIAQTYPVAEIVISDDCSTDSTRTVLLEYQAMFPDKIKLILNEKNVGFIKNFERAISDCRSEFIALCDQDDVWDDVKIEMLVSTIGNHDLIHSDARLVDADKKIIAPSFTLYSKKTVARQSFTDVCINNSVTGCTCMFRRALLGKAMPFPLFLPHDHWLAIIAKDGNGIAYCPLSLISYRQHGNNAIGAKDATNTTRGNKKKTRSRREILHDKQARYNNLYENARAVLSANGSRKIKRLAEYYASYFRKKIRVRSFLFHLIHLRTFSNRKNVVQAIHALLYALYNRR